MGPKEAERYETVDRIWSEQLIHLYLRLSFINLYGWFKPWNGSFCFDKFSDLIKSVNYNYPKIQK